MKLFTENGEYIKNGMNFQRKNMTAPIGPTKEVTY